MNKDRAALLRNDPVKVQVEYKHIRNHINADTDETLRHSDLNNLHSSNRGSLIPSQNVSSLASNVEFRTKARGKSEPRQR